MFRQILTFALALPAFAQSIEGSVFEVTALKKIGPTTRAIQTLKGGPGSDTPNQAVMINRVYDLVTAAFDLPPSRIAIEAALPKDFYELNALVPAGASKEDLRAMYRNLLIERFHLRFHRETREVTVYEMTVAGGGHKLKPSGNAAPPKPKSETAIGSKVADGYIDLPPGMNVGPVGFPPNWALQRVGTTMEEFTRDIENQIRGVVMNKTGLTGKFDFSLRWSTQLAAGPNALAFLEPTFRPALKEQLGLVLNEGKRPMEMVVIDAIDSEATEN